MILKGLIRELWAVRLRKVQFRDGYGSGTDTEGHSQVFSSQSEGESATDASARSARRKKGTPDGAVNLGDTLVICYTATLLLRIPLTVVDLINLIDNGSLPYYQAINHVPKSLVEKLPGEYQALLEPQTLLSSQDLQRKIFDSSRALHTDLGMAFPAINHPLLLRRWMQELALPIEVFAATTRLARMLDHEFTIPMGTVARSSFAIRYPEVRLMALLVVSTKLLFPTDDIKRDPTTPHDLSALQMDWVAWESTQANNTNEGQPLRHSEAFNRTDLDCLTMDDEQLDRYLDWYQENLSSETIREQGRAGKEADFRVTMMRMFPTRLSRAELPDPQSETSLRELQTSARLRDTQQNLKMGNVRVPDSRTSDEKGSRGIDPRAGNFYKRFREASELSGPVKRFYERAAALGGMSLGGMVKATFAIELKLHKHEELLRKAEQG